MSIESWTLKVYLSNGKTKELADLEQYMNDETIQGIDDALSEWEQDNQ